MIVTRSLPVSFFVEPIRTCFSIYFFLNVEAFAPPPPIRLSNKLLLLCEQCLSFFCFIAVFFFFLHFLMNRRRRWTIRLGSQWTMNRSISLLSLSFTQYLRRLSRLFHTKRVLFVVFCNFLCKQKGDTEESGSRCGINNLNLLKQQQQQQQLQLPSPTTEQTTTAEWNEKRISVCSANANSVAEKFSVFFLLRRRRRHHSFRRYRFWSATTQYSVIHLFRFDNELVL